MGRLCDGGESEGAELYAELVFCKVSFAMRPYALCMLTYHVLDSMGTGILSILLYTLPYQFRGLRTIGTIVFFLNLVLFVIFFMMSL